MKLTNNTFKMYIILLSLCLKINSEPGVVCGEGCLRCKDPGEATEECLICDSFMSYILNGKKCQKEDLANCLI